MESEAFEDIQKGGGALRTIKDLGAGAAGGIAQVLLGKFVISYPDCSSRLKWFLPIVLVPIFVVGFVFN